MGLDEESLGDLLWGFRFGDFILKISDTILWGFRNGDLFWGFLMGFLRGLRGVSCN